MIKIYRTGDLARWLPEGDIEFLGRIDRQVKNQGYRIELEAIENRLSKYPGLKEVVVSTVGSETGDKYLCAYLVPVTGDVAPHEVEDTNRTHFLSDGVQSAIKEYLSEFLPGYMIPDYWVEMEEMPLASNGKIDRKALPAPQLKTGADHSAPRNHIEIQLARLWAEVLGIQQSIIGIDDNFFEVGGHSLSAGIMASKILEELGVDVPLVEVLKTPFIRQLAEFIKNSGTVEIKKNRRDIVSLGKEYPEAEDFFLVHDGSGEVEGYVEFCKHLDIPVNCWGIRAPELENYTPGNRSIDTIAGAYIGKIQAIQPRGPYMIGGWSIGGTIAFEMVRQLEISGAGVSFFALFDSPPPTPGSHGNSPGNTYTFTLETEKSFVKKYLADEAIEEKMETINGIDEFWPFIVETLENKRFDPATIKKIIMEYEAHVVPNYHQLGIGDLIRYLNIGRMLRNARASYIPSSQLHTPVHYFAAGQSTEIEKERWNKYCEVPINIYEIVGDHYSIFKRPHVLEPAQVVSKLLARR
ncbi:MAG: hypothetical protein GY940_35555 [bacterium]|nr:hypothetical protein [bacterium]